MAEAMGIMATQKRIIFRSLFLKKFLGIPTFKRKRERRTVKVSEMEWQRVGRKTSRESFTMEYTGNNIMCFWNLLTKY